MLDRVREELTQLSVKRGSIEASAENLRRLAAIRSRLMGVLLSPEYIASVRQYLAAFDEITRLQNAYFRGINERFRPPEIAAELRSQALQMTAENLTERGMGANVIKAVESMLSRAITSGGSIADLQNALTESLTTTANGDGLLERYTKQITTDAINQYSAQYTQLISSDLGLEWFVYAGSNLKTTRPFCLAMTEKRYVHISEFPALLRGDFPEFDAHGGRLYKGLPEGMYPDTTPENLQVNRGGYNCGHQLRPVSAAMVPAAIRAKFEG
jgi:hypothetical protein